MKLLSCYIENFGGLHQYTVQFRDGLTVLEAPNGFGKTTLAEFIRAMFYGFPRANKDLLKNPRQKYLPWQGGKYGGWLLFEHQGHRYRIERTFGERPAQDKFKLINEDTGRESAAYTANIGEELFGIDADAFQRSTYLPQNHEGGPLSTDSIRAKLGNLLEDTGDMAGYEKAITRLQERRKLYELQRGSGGSIHRAQQQMTALQQDIHAAEACRPELDILHEDMAAAMAQQAAAATDLKTVRSDISAAAQLQADAALSRQYEGLYARTADLAAQERNLSAQYPLGIPTETELQQAGDLLDRMALLHGSLAETDSDRVAAETAEQLASVFARGLPTDDLFSQGEALYKDTLTLQAGITTAVMSDIDRQLLEKLEAQFAPGVPDDGWFDAREKDCRELKDLKRRQAELTLSPREAAGLQNLEQFFAPGIPSESTLAAHAKQWEQAQGLRQDALRIDSAITPAAAPIAQPKTFHGGFFPAMLFALLLGALGGCVLAMQNTLFALFLPPQLSVLQPALDFVLENPLPTAGISLGVAALLLILAVILQVMQSLRNEMARSAIAAAQLQAQQQARVQHLLEEAAQLEADVLNFLRLYPTDSQMSPPGQLRELRDRAAALTDLRRQKAKLSAAAGEMTGSIARLETSIHRQLQPYHLLQTLDTGLTVLRSRRDRYLALTEIRKQMEENADTLCRQLDVSQTALAELLHPYCGTVAPADFHSALTALRRDRDRFTAAQAQLAARKAALARRDAQAAELAEALHKLSETYKLPLQTKAHVEAVRDHLRLQSHLHQQQTCAQRELDDFIARHGARPAADLPQIMPDMEALKAAEQACLRRQSECAEHLSRLQRKEQQLMEVLDTLPGLQDELERVTAQKAADTHSKELLDKTITLLTQSRESLSNRYLGGVHSHFTQYLTRLTGEPAGLVRMNSDLEVQLERSGEARPLAHFSAGQADIISLCMRLSLADALFEEEPCFMILDDPFVNLDDIHTKQALELLQELAKDRQFIYLVCHSSRAI